MTTRSVGWHRLMARSQVEQLAAECRMRHITGLAGQDMVYAGKLAQAQAYLLAWTTDKTAPVPPYVAADVAAEGATAVVRARAIVAAAESFHVGPGPAIERVRRTAKVALQAARTPEAVQQVLDRAVEALAAI